MPQLPFYNRQVTTQGLGAGPVNLPNSTTDQQFLDEGSDAASRAAVSIQSHLDDTSVQDNLLKLTYSRYNLAEEQQKKLGINADGSSDQALSQFDDYAATLRQNIPQSRMEEWDRQAAITRLQLQSTTDTHELDQHQAFKRGQYEGNREMAIADAQTFRADTPNYQLTLARMKDNITSYGQSNGWSPELIDGEIRKTEQQMSQNATQAYIADWRTKQLTSPTTFTPGDLSSDKVFSAMIPAESGGRQFNGNGQTLTSPAGAMGIAQVLPATAEETAKKHGMQWDPQRFMSDASYNMQIGQLYHQDLTKKYGGNQALAVAAYNAGPGAVDDWINGTNKAGKNPALLRLGDPNKGDISSDQFIAGIPFSETRNYTMNVLSRAQSLPPEAEISQIQKMPWFQNASPEQKSQFLGQVSAEVNRQRAYGMQNLQDTMQNNMAQMQNGIMPTRDVTRQEYLSYLPQGATAPQLEQFNRLYDEYEATKALVPTYNTIMTQPVAMAQQSVQALYPQPNDPDFDRKLSLYQKATAQLQQVTQQRKSDPGAWFMKNSPLVQQAYNSWQQNPADPAMAQSFIASVQSEKSRFGISSQKVLPDSIAQAMAEGFNNNKETTVESIRQQLNAFGPYSQAVGRQIMGQSKNGPLVGALSAGNPRASVPLWQERNTPTSALKESVVAKNGKGADTSVVQEWADASADFRQTMLVQPGGAGSWSTLDEQGQRLTMINVLRGMDAGAAAKQAAADMFTSQYTVNDTYRVPTYLGYQPDYIARGASLFKDKLTADQLQPLNFGSNTPDEFTKSQTLYEVKNNAHWVNNSDDTGLVLYLGNNVQNDASGNPITVSFADLDKMAKADPSWWQSVKKFASRETTYTPGTERDARAQNLQGLRETYGGQSQSGPSFSEGMRDTNANIR
ncbi:TPA: transglycosylase SLT domain-containing protein [Klebsiella pneumoniae]|uniref:lytic transglycosylase domain-containing protein n=1 Tax=Klebsiella pneumoniae complex TaxID=3390273 RepID=UPI0007CA5828|nr:MULTISPECIES: lytic transglycosylase domain-containing protein [Klebsiella]EKU0048218.1 transglycosylase SLT domain-containing protein [Klebsiella quasipneumoniae]HDU4119652.1 transglycosylase SLT domain-containing protein [Klebsiella pneumoniae subsp. pneumoniae]EIW9040926.1 transglycosylase [Klebsiella pneumoniae]EKU3499709.1 transglycosylase SLT domain-containing protein [Klebsiella quasipneumoniae]EKU3504600.1 transglycosylase SLT domain-containing protein [Klebsiella quasipneumoniae]